MENKMIQKTFPGEIDSLSPIRDYINEQAIQAGLDKMSAYNLCLAIDEVATNIINYGYIESGLSGDIDVIIENSGNTLTITLEDRALQFDPRDNDLPSDDDLNLPLEERAIGGLGIFLVFSSVDKFEYEFVDGKNRNIFTMNLNNKQ
jgi:anti-sigma regulatory factor (Ser/Thr protein kinase)